MPKQHHGETRDGEPDQNHQGEREMPSSLPGQEIGSDGLKLPLSDEQKQKNKEAREAKE